MLLACVLGLSLAETTAAGHRCKMMNPQKYCLSVESRQVEKELGHRNREVIQNLIVWRCPQLSGNMDKFLTQPKSPNAAKINVLLIHALRT